MIALECVFDAVPAFLLLILSSLLLSRPPSLRECQSGDSLEICKIYISFCVCLLLAYSIME